MKRATKMVNDLFRYRAEENDNALRRMTDEDIEDICQQDELSPFGHEVGRHRSSRYRDDYDCDCSDDQSIGIESLIDMMD